MYAVMLPVFVTVIVYVVDLPLKYDGENATSEVMLNGTAFSISNIPLIILSSSTKWNTISYIPTFALAKSNEAEVLVLLS